MPQLANVKPEKIGNLWDDYTKTMHKTMHPNGSLIGSLAKFGDRRLHKCGPLILCYHLRPTLRLARGGWILQDGPQKLMVYHDAKLATNHRTTIHIDFITHICVYSYTYLIIYNTCLFLHIFLYMCINIFICIYYMPWDALLFSFKVIMIASTNEAWQRLAALSGWI